MRINSLRVSLAGVIKRIQGLLKKREAWKIKVHFRTNRLSFSKSAPTLCLTRAGYVLKNAYNSPTLPRPQQRLINEGFFEFKKKAGDGMCWVKGCRNQSRDDRSLCHKHEMRRWRSKHKCSAAYHSLKFHAKERRIEFTITADYFRGLTDAYCFFDQGDSEEILTIDRVNPVKGYVCGNLRVVSLSVNVVKGNKERHLPEHVQEMLRRQRVETRAEHNAHLEDDEDPF